MKTSHALLTALALATASLTAQAADISAPTKILTLDADGFSAFGDKFAGNHALDTFTDKFQFTSTALSSLTADVTSYDKPNGGLNLTQFSLFDGNGSLVGGTQVSTGAEDHWTLSYNNLAVGTYYVQVAGNIFGKPASSFSGNVSLTALSPVPEPETYAMMLAGLGMVGFAARRRKQNQA